LDENTILPKEEEVKGEEKVKKEENIEDDKVKEEKEKEKESNNKKEIKDKKDIKNIFKRDESFFENCEAKDLSEDDVNELLERWKILHFKTKKNQKKKFLK
jgi:hypothetical protein